MSYTWKIVSWNVNGIRAALRKGFADWVENETADVIGLQEVRATEALASKELSSFRPFVHVVEAEKKGYSGVGLLSKETPLVETSLGSADFDSEGRVQICRYGELTVANIYFPNGSGKNRDNSRIPFKLGFYQRLFDLLEEERSAGQYVVVMGDFNTAHRDIDLARPKDNRKTSGFRPEECDELERWLTHGYTDTFRALHPEQTGAYTWWSQRKGVRERNVGWRIDYILVATELKERIVSASIMSEQLGSDHCPIVLELDVSGLNLTNT